MMPCVYSRYRRLIECTLCMCVCVCVLRFVYLVFAHYELELCDPEAVMPEVEASRYGFGMLQPAGDLDVRYKLRASL